MVKAISIIKEDESENQKFRTQFHSYFTLHSLSLVTVNVNINLKLTKIENNPKS